MISLSEGLHGPESSNILIQQIKIVIEKNLILIIYNELNAIDDYFSDCLVLYLIDINIFH